MNIESGIAIYLTIWWTALFAILPLGVRSYAEEGKPVPGGGDPFLAGQSEPEAQVHHHDLGRRHRVGHVCGRSLHFHLITLPSFGPSH